tara:strand:+ start:595 stop:1560 length:966 start_codon:yes stop_codon:yes gene_type:complete
MLYNKEQVSNILNFSKKIYLWRSGGIGDVFMFLPVLNFLIKSYKKTKFQLLTGIDIDFFKNSRVKKYITSDKIVYEKKPNFLGLNDSFVPLNSIHFGVKDNHQIDNYFEYFNLNPSNKDKRIDLLFNFPKKSSLENEQKIVTIHASNGDVNRTWPKKNYLKLINELLSKNFIINLIGKSSNFDGNFKGLHNFKNLNINDYTNKLSPHETMLLINRSDLFISTDTGPVQLAIATNTPIICIYSVVKGNNRLSFNKSSFSNSITGKCDHYGCFHSKLSSEFLNANGGDSLSDFCFLQENKYSCLIDIKPNRILEEVYSFFLIK